MTKFHSLAIKNIKRETVDCISISFDIPTELKDAYQYKQGQYLTLKLPVGGEILRRSYSICTSPFGAEEMRIAIKKVDKGLASNYLNQIVKVGDFIEVLPAVGNFYTEMIPSNNKNYVAFTAGSGITPIMSLIKTVLLVEPNSHFTLIYGNKNEASVIFKSEIDGLVQKYPTQLKVKYVYTRESNKSDLFSGRIDKPNCKKIFDTESSVKNGHEYFLCGPLDMINAVSETLNESGIKKEHIHFELFTSPVNEESVSATLKSDVVDDASAVTECTAKIVLDGDEKIIKIKKNQTVLEAVLDAGMDAPYACTGGSCCTCRAKVLEGHAVMDVNYALSDSEVKKGYILTCQSHPTTPTITVDYDKS
jgi:ring-1,2-phenylacetyl-CoA epoxidase subunit PaaE